MSRRESAVLIGTCAALALAPRPASGYVALFGSDGGPRTWHTIPVSWTLQAQGSDDLPLDEVVDVLTASFATWADVPCASIDFVFQGISTEPPAEGIWIHWVESSWSASLPPGAGAMPCSTPYDCPWRGPRRSGRRGGRR